MSSVVGLLTIRITNQYTEFTLFSFQALRTLIYLETTVRLSGLAIFTLCSCTMSSSLWLQQFVWSTSSHLPFDRSYAHGKFLLFFECINFYLKLRELFCWYFYPLFQAPECISFPISSSFVEAWRNYFAFGVVKPVSEQNGFWKRRSWNSGKVIRWFKIWKSKSKIDFRSWWPRHTKEYQRRLKYSLYTYSFKCFIARDEKRRGDFWFRS